MEEKALVLEGLPTDLELVRPKLGLYFRNKSKSGGEVREIRDHPEDKRKALLLYNLEAGTTHYSVTSAFYLTPDKMLQCGQK